MRAGDGVQQTGPHAAGDERLRKQCGREGREQESDLQHAGLSLSEAEFQAVVGSRLRSYIVECSGERKHRNTFSQVDQQKNCLSGKNMMRLHLMTFIQLKNLVQIANKFYSNLLF